MSNSIDSYVILFLSIAISLITIFYYMRVIAYLFVGDDSQSRSTSISVDVVAFNRIALFQGSIAVIIIF